MFNRIFPAMLSATLMALTVGLETESFPIGAAVFGGLAFAGNALAYAIATHKTVTELKGLIIGQNGEAPEAP